MVKVVVEVRGHVEKLIVIELKRKRTPVEHGDRHGFDALSAER